MNARYRLLSMAVGILIVIVVIITAGWLCLNPAPLVVQGEVEATQVKVSAKIAGRIYMLHVKEGDTVSPGQVLVSLDSPEIQAKLSQVKGADLK